MRMLVALAFALGHLRAEENVRPPSRVITLDEAYDLTLASDQSIRIAFLEIRKANLLPWSALTRLGPSLTGSGNFDRSQTRSTGGTIVTSTDNGTFITSPTTTNAQQRGARLSFQQTLVDFTVFPAYHLGKLSARSARLEYQFTVRQTLFGVAQAYYAVLKDQSVVAINQQTVDLAGQQLDLSRKRYNAGDVARLDVSRARATLEDARNTLIQSQNTLAVDRNVLANILNLGGDVNFKLAEPPAAPVVDAPFETVLNNAFTRREDFLAAKIAIDQDIARRNEIIGEYAPRIVAQTSEGLTDYPGLTRDNRVWDATLSVQMPFLTGGQRELDLITANHQINETRLNFEKTKKSLQEEVKNAWLQVGTLQASLVALRAEVEANVQNYNDLQAQYQAGSATSLDVQAALRDLNNSRTMLTGQVYAFQVALRDLQRAQADFQEGRVPKLK